MDVELVPNGNIGLVATGSLSLNGSCSRKLFLQSAADCEWSHLNGNNSLSVCAEAPHCDTMTVWHAQRVAVEHSHLGKVLERQLASHRWAGGTTLTPADGGNYSMSLLSAELSRLHCQDLSLDSYAGSVWL